MAISMRLFRRPPKTRPLPPESEWTWYAELDRRTRISLKTAWASESQQAEAQGKIKI
jgi:hypothetical protein